MSNDINFGGILETLNDKSDRDLQNTLGGGVLDYVVEAQTFEDGSWYRKYKSGWLEQGGIYYGSGSTNPSAVVVTLPYAMSSENYTAVQGCGVGSSGWQYANGATIEHKTTTTFSTRIATGTGTIGVNWVVYGY